MSVWIQILKSWGKWMIILFIIYIGYRVFATMNGPTPGERQRMKERNEKYIADYKESLDSDSIPESDSARVYYSMQKIARNLKPEWIDSITYCIGAEVFPDRIFQYEYMLKIDKSKYDLKRLKELLTRELPRRIGHTLDNFKKNNYTVNYNYHDANGNFLFKVELTPDKY